MPADVHISYSEDEVRAQRSDAQRLDDIEAKIDRVLAIHEMILTEVKNFKLPPMVANMFALMGPRNG